MGFHSTENCELSPWVDGLIIQIMSRLNFNET